MLLATHCLILDKRLALFATVCWIFLKVELSQLSCRTCTTLLYHVTDANCPAYKPCFSCLLVGTFSPQLWWRASGQEATDTEDDDIQGGADGGIHTLLIPGVVAEKKGGGKGGNVPDMCFLCPGKLSRSHPAIRSLILGGRSSCNDSLSSRVIRATTPPSYTAWRITLRYANFYLDALPVNRIPLPAPIRH